MSRCKQKRALEEKRKMKADSSQDPVTQKLETISQQLQGPREPAGESVPQGFTQSALNQVDLKEGSYDVSFRIPMDIAEAVAYENKQIRVVQGGETKRVKIHRMEIYPLDEKEQGHKMARLVAKITVLDNLAISTSLLLGGLGITSAFTAGWFFVDKVERYTTESVPGMIGTVAAGVLVLVIGKVVFTK